MAPVGSVHKRRIKTALHPSLVFRSSPEEPDPNLLPPSPIILLSIVSMMPKGQTTTGHSAGDKDVSRGSVATGLFCALFVIMFCVVGGIIVAAIDGLIVMLVGNSILSAHYPHYATPMHAIMIGIVGSPISAIVVALVYWGLRICFRPCSGRVAAVLHPCYTALGHTLSAFGAGVIGTAVLRKAGVDLGEINALRAGAAGALGSAIICAGALAVMLLFAVCFGVSLFGLFAVDAVLDENGSKGGDSSASA